MANGRVTDPPLQGLRCDPVGAGFKPALVRASIGRPRDLPLASIPPGHLEEEATRPAAPGSLAGDGAGR